MALVIKTIGCHRLFLETINRCLVCLVSYIFNGHKTGNYKIGDNLKLAVNLKITDLLSVRMIIVIVKVVMIVADIWTCYLMMKLLRALCGTFFRNLRDFLQKCNPYRFGAGSAQSQDNYEIPHCEAAFV